MFGPDARAVLDALVASGILRRRPSGWFWAREDRPAEHISLRGASDVVAVVEARTGRVLGTVDEASSPPRCTPAPCTCTRATPGWSPSSTSRPGPRTWCGATPGGRPTPSR